MADYIGDTSLAAIRSRCARWDDTHPVSKMRGGEEWAEQFRADVGDLEEHARMLQQQLDEALRESEDHRLAMVESDRQRDKARAEVERLRARLRPFAEFLDALEVHGGWDPPDGWIVRIDTDPPVTLAYEELVRARQALLDDQENTT